MVPQTVPRPSALPKPGPDTTHTIPCAEGGGKVTETWRKGGLFWSRSEFIEGGGCTVS
jgi:hypothetical protein